MLPVSRSHEAYLQFVAETLYIKFKTEKSKELLQTHYSDLIFWVVSIDLSKTASLLKHQYSPKTIGRKPRDPSDLLRSILIMTKLKKSVDEWVYQLRTNPIYAILSGFHPESTPGVGTFYDFFRRLWLLPSPHYSKRQKRKLKRPRKKRKKE